MVAITASVNTELIRRKLRGQKSQVPFAMSLTLNAMAKTTKDIVDKQIKSKLDRPTRYATNMMFVKRSAKRNLVAEVKVKDSATVTKRGFVGPDQILGHLFKGGNRRTKGFEGLLRDIGVLPRDRYIVPGQGIRLDSNGNIPRSVIIQLLSYFRAFKESGFRANMSDKNRKSFGRRFVKKNIKGASFAKFFHVLPGDKRGLHPGVYIKVQFGSGTAIKPYLIFVKKQPTYRQYFDIEETANKVILKDVDREFKKNYEFATRTAK